VVITGGGAPPGDAVKRWLDEATIIVAADSGVETAARYGVRASLVVGDFDSLTEQELLGQYDVGQIRRFPAAKDHTDTELALNLAWEEGADEVVLIGGGGGRLDHLLAIVSLFERPRHPSVWVSDGSEVRAVDDELLARGVPGERISFFPLGSGPCTMESHGLRWPLDSMRWERGDVGVSNEFADSEVCVKMKQGRLLMIRPIRSE
jgi:thiamine pyrophosphokinase